MGSGHGEAPFGAVGDRAADGEFTVGSVDLDTAGTSDLVSLLDRHVDVRGPELAREHPDWTGRTSGAGILGDASPWDEHADVEMGVIEAAHDASEDGVV